MMRVYGAMMWQLGKVFRTPEVCRVYIGSFNAQRTVRECELKGLFEAEQDALLKDLLSIPQKSGDRKVSWEPGRVPSPDSPPSLRDTQHAGPLAGQRVRQARPCGTNPHRRRLVPAQAAARVWQAEGPGQAAGEPGRGVPQSPAGIPAAGGGLPGPVQASLPLHVPGPRRRGR